ncbi:hypothetical protein [Oryza sativa Japonica Group]|uniref:Uncharacterized protein n=1 Tax=Oryza sativa subsp. japonica TaxID=39947 RepID=Q94D68_ORYSJ|nr:hypothetical protein [Oryza sativa Japonica Group]
MNGAAARRHIFLGVVLAFLLFLLMYKTLVPRAWPFLRRPPEMRKKSYVIFTNGQGR